MTVKRIVAHLETTDIPALETFYAKLFDMPPVMQMEWISTMANGASGPLQVSATRYEGGTLPVPRLSIEVEDVDATHAKAIAMCAKIVYPLRDEPWNVRRFFVEDPAGHVLNVLSHI